MGNNHKNQGKVEQYDLKKWAEETKIGKRLLIWKYFMAGNEFKGWTLIKTISEQIYDGKKNFTYLWQKDDDKGEELIRIDVIESISWRQSQELLLKQLIEDYQALQLPEAISRNIELGDAAFIGLGETILSIIFTRANMLVRMHSVGKKNIPVVNIAEQVDKLLVTRPKRSKKGVIPEIEVFSSDRKVAKINELVTFDIKAKDPLGRNIWYKFMVDQGELSVKNEKVSFLSEIQGQPEITSYVINENGYITDTTLTIRVE